MIIACPACGTRYAVPDSAIGNEGRTVRCAKCKHSWFQEPPERELTLPVKEQPDPGLPAVARAPAAAPPPPATLADAPPAAREADEAAPEPRPQPSGSSQADDRPSVSHWRTGDRPDGAAAPEPDESIALRALRRGLAGRDQDEDSTAPDVPVSAPVFPEPVADPEPPFEDTFPDEDEGESRFDYRAPFTRRRNTLRMWTIAAAIFAVLATGTVLAVNTYGLPDWVPISRPTFGVGQPGLELDFPSAEQRSETLANGETIFRVRGTIRNTARETLDVPNLLVVFSDARERKVGDWVVVPAERKLAPGESITVTEAIANIPPGAQVADLGWAPG